MDSESPNFLHRLKLRAFHRDVRSVSPSDALLEDERLASPQGTTALSKDMDILFTSSGDKGRFDSIANPLNSDVNNRSTISSLAGFNSAPIGPWEAGADPLGLNLVTSPAAPVVDIIFIHGLGGSSLKSWSWKHDPRKFWVQWLGDEPELSGARLWTYGFASGIKGASTSLNIHDFAKDLLFKMKHGTTPGSPIGSVPIFFVTHSMGGLVAKKAFLSGRQNEDYAGIISRVQAMVFFSTPHRGGNGADALSTLLKVVGMSKPYIKDLMANSTFLQSINEDFAQVCGDLQLFSFYETQKTSTPAGNLFVVDKASAILNLPNETSNSMVADHHTVCKFETRDDARFRDIRNVLIRLTKTYMNGAIETIHPPHAMTDLNHLGEILAIDPSTVDDNLNRLLSSAKPGTCRWITESDWFSSWLYEDGGPHVLWISGPAAAGKSVLAAYITELLRESLGYECQHHTFDFMDKPTRSSSYLLRSFAFQIARGRPTLNAELQATADQSGVSFSSMSAPTVWEKIFRGVILNRVADRTLYWVIDGLDEAELETVPLIFQCLKTLNAGFRLRVLLVSRETNDIAMRLSQLSPLKYMTYHLSQQDTFADIRNYVEEAINTTIPREVAASQSIVSQILAKASGNFLWVTLATRELEQRWHRQSNIDEVLGGCPGEMAPLYHRMMESIHERPEHMKRMAIVFLTWVTYAFRPLKLDELQAAVCSEFPDLNSLEDTIKSVCGDFVRLQENKISLVHETARYYLTHYNPRIPESLRPLEANEYVAKTCLRYLASSRERQWKQILHLAEIQRSRGSLSALSTAPDVHEAYPLLSYAARAWAYHFSLASPVSQSLLDLVLEFFSNDALTWINTLALLGDLKALIRTSQYLKAYLKARMKMLAENPPGSLRDDSGAETLKLWATDIIRLVGKFGINLTQHPSSIYKLIPPFCPSSSMLGAASGQSMLTVLKGSMADWDDCHARLTVGSEVSGRRLVPTSEVFAALVPGAQSLVVWHAVTCEEIRRLHHGEYVTEAAVNRKGDTVCISGRETIKVWGLSTGQELACLRKHSHDRILSVGFGAEDDQVLVGYQNHLIVCQNWRTRDIVYQFRAGLSDDPNAHSGLRVVSFSPDGTKLVVGPMGRPVDLWDLTTQSRAARCVMKYEVANADHDVFLQAEVVQWHPTSGNIYILYHNTTLIDWNPVYDEKAEHHIQGAKGMACSPCGNYLLTFSSGGSVKVFELPDYSQSETVSKLRLVYHLEHPELIRDVAFAPDGRRFYDLRDSICSVWEPEALVPAERQDKLDTLSTSESSGTTVTPRSSPGPGLPPVTAIACAPSDLGFCFGNDDGAISILEMTAGKRVRTLPGHTSGMAIIGLTWSSSGNWIASADDSGRVLVRKVRMGAGPGQETKVYKPSEFRVRGDGINQLLFSSNDRYLLISTSSADRMWDVREKRICHVRDHPSPRRVKWTEHPSDPLRLMSVDAGEVHIFCWSDFVDLTPGDGLSFVRTDQNSITGKGKTTCDAISADARGLHHDGGGVPTTSAEFEVSSITKVHGNRSIVLETLPSEGYECDRLKRRRIEIIQVRDLTPHAMPGQLVLERGAPELVQEVLKVVGSYMNRLVFFNHQHWLCTWELGTTVKTYKRHFFLPKDWATSEALRLSVLSDRGTLLCPRNGEVAIIKDGINF